MNKVVTILTNDPETPSVDVPVSVFVEHGVDGQSEGLLEDTLFGQEECAECHADPAGELAGSSLYVAVCEMCHGSIGEYAASLPSSVLAADALRTWIADGEADVGMPGYSAARGGPLTDEQIDTLVDVILSAADEFAGN